MSMAAKFHLLVQIDETLLTARFLLPQRDASARYREGVDFHVNIPDLVCPREDAALLWEHSEPGRAAVLCGGRMLIGDHIHSGLNGAVLTEVAGITIRNDLPGWREGAWIAIPQIPTAPRFGWPEPPINLSSLHSDLFPTSGAIPFEHWGRVCKRLDRSIHFRFKVGPTSSFFGCAFEIAVHQDGAGRGQLSGTPMDHPDLFQTPPLIIHREAP